MSLNRYFIRCYQRKVVIIFNKRTLYTASATVSSSQSINKSINHLEEVDVHTYINHAYYTDLCATNSVHTFSLT